MVCMDYVRHGMGMVVHGVHGHGALAAFNHSHRFSKQWRNVPTGVSKSLCHSHSHKCQPQPMTTILGITPTLVRGYLQGEHVKKCSPEPLKKKHYLPIHSFLPSRAKGSYRFRFSVRASMPPCEDAQLE